MRLTTLTVDLDVVTTVNVTLRVFYHIKTCTRAHTQERKEEGGRGDEEFPFSLQFRSARLGECGRPVWAPLQGPEWRGAAFRQGVVFPKLRRVQQ